MRELAIIERIRRAAGPQRGLVLGIGDDCAIFRPRAGEDLVFTTDLLIEDVHFRRATHRAPDIGHKTLARGLSDIAAMGAEPRFCLVSLAAARDLPPAWISRFYRGLLALASATGTTLAGGDLARGTKIACDIAVCGAVPRGQAMRRAGARPGDAIWVSGMLGASALGLRTGLGTAWRRHLRPEPRLALGQYLRRCATACMDLSDGLSIDLQRLCLASGVSAELNNDIPVFPGATPADALHGGEDYELLFTVPAHRKLPGTAAGVALTRVGTIGAGRPGAIRLNGRPIEPLGWDHFR